MKEGLKNVTAGANPVFIKRGIDKAVERVVAEMKELATPVEDKQDIAHIASISGNDLEVGQIMADAMNKVGKDES